MPKFKEIYEFLYRFANVLVDKLLELQAKRQESRVFKDERSAKMAILKQAMSAKIDVDDQCRACGARSGDIRYDPRLKKVIHVCRICGASWLEDPIYADAGWDYTGRNQDEIEQRRLDVDTVFSRGTIVTKGDSNAKKQDKPTG